MTSLYESGFSPGDKKLQDACAQLWPDLRQASENLQSLIVTGCNGGEGVSSIAFALGCAAQKLGVSRVLLVDASPSPNNLTQALAPGSSRGLRQFRESDTDLAALVKPVRPGLDILPFGTGTDPTLPSDKDLAALRDRAHQIYDVVILDAPPVTHSVETKRLIALFGNVILVTETDRTSSAKVSAALEQIRALSLEPLLVLRNRAARAFFGFGTRSA